jgi:hypothetical protein
LAIDPSSPKRTLSHAGPEESGYGFSKAKVGANLALKGKLAQVSTVRTKKLVFSLN